MNGRSPNILVGDMLDSAERIAKLLEGMTKDDFLAEENVAVQDAVSYRVVVIGEAAASLLAKCPDFCQAHPEIPWKSAKAMRNFVVHEYMSVDLERLWETAVFSIPELIAQLRALALYALSPQAYGTTTPAGSRSI